MALEHPHNPAGTPAELLEGDMDHSGCISPQHQASSHNQHHSAHQGFPPSEKWTLGLDETSTPYARPAGHDSQANCQAPPHQPRGLPAASGPPPPPCTILHCMQPRAQTCYLRLCKRHPVAAWSGERGRVFISPLGDLPCQTGLQDTCGLAV